MVSKWFFSRFRKELFEYLAFIQQTPGMSASERDKAYSISGAKGTRLRKELTELGLIRAGTIRQGRGRPVTDVQVTDKGEKYLKIN